MEFKRADTGFNRINEEVLCAATPNTLVNGRDLEFLKEKALGNKRKRIRFCFHPDTAATLHEMLIVQTKDTYIRPHKNMNKANKAKSYHVVEGRIMLMIFDDGGVVTNTIAMGEKTSGDVFYCRFSSETFHTVRAMSDVAIFQETIDGPFSSGDTVFAPWAPGEEDTVGQEAFIARILPGAPQ